ncbi:hypothetical protein [Methylobacterium segetis]|uniref:hypothetical protein n=1 Tax=Methylobacterium segetis TaxID=2488750 RepID=UPI001042CE54|nr:hypothetical protein [Methylobacterium segetis]
MFDHISLDHRLTAAVTNDIADAVRAAAELRGLTVADYVRGSVQARLMLDGARFARLPNLQRVTARPGRGRSI